MTAYCKKCGRDVEAGESCPYCGNRLGKTSAHAAWCVERTPVKDWMYWNSVMRLILPAGLIILVLVLALSWISGGTGAVEKMLASGFLPVLGILILAVLALILVALLLQGKELSDFVVDNRGIHETRYLPDPTPVKLLLRLKSPAAARKGEGQEAVLKLSERHLAWKNVARVQLWPEKCMILFYSPAWWLQIPVICNPFSWEDTFGFIRDKLGKRKKVKLPLSLTVPAASGNSRRSGNRAVSMPLREPEAADGQAGMDDWGRAAASPADMPPEAGPDLPDEKN